MTTAVIANLVMASFCHAHGEPAEPSFLPHIHCRNSGHSHDQGHGHSHQHDHSHHHGHQHDSDQSEALENDDSSSASRSHDSDLIYFSCSEIILSHPCELENFSSTIAFPPEFRVNHRLADYHASPHKDFPRVVAHALILKKIRLLL